MDMTWGGNSSAGNLEEMKLIWENGCAQEKHTGCRRYMQVNPLKKSENRNYLLGGLAFSPATLSWLW